MFDVVYVADGGFACQTAVSLSSLLRTNSSNFDRVFVVDTGLSAEDRSRISTVASLYDRHIVFVDASDAMSRLAALSIDMPNDTGNKSTLVRLFLNEFMPDDVESVLYLDGDTLILDDLRPLLAMPRRHTLGAALDAFHELQGKGILRDNASYFNAGVLLMELHSYGERLSNVDVITMIESEYPFADQDILNKLFEGDVDLFEPRFNATTKYRNVSPANLATWCGGGPAKMYTEDQLVDAHDRPAIVHYTTCMLGRPWESDCEDASLALWRAELKRTPWDGVPLRSTRRSWTSRCGRILKGFLPERAFVRFDHWYAARKYARLYLNHRTQSRFMCVS